MRARTDPTTRKPASCAIHAELFQTAAVLRCPSGNSHARKRAVSARSRYGRRPNAGLFRVVPICLESDEHALVGTKDRVVESLTVDNAPRRQIEIGARVNIDGGRCRTDADRGVTRRIRRPNIGPPPVARIT